MAAMALLDEIEVRIEPEVDLVDDEFYEVVDGRRIETPPMSYYAGIVAS